MGLLLKNFAIKNTNSIDKRFQEFITEGAWGTVWAGDILSNRDRSLITIALLASLGHNEELEMHINASKNTGATYEEISETLMHVAVYAGVPAKKIKTLSDYKESIASQVVLTKKMLQCLYLSLGIQMF